MTIRNKFLIPTIALIVLGMGGSTIISYFKSQNALSTALLQNIQQQTKAASTSLESWVNDRRLDIQSWSRDEVYARAMSNSIIGKSARVSANEKMKRLKADYGYYDDILLADKDGGIVATSAEGGASDKINIKDRDYFKAAIAGNTFVSDVAFSRNSGNTVLPAMAALK